MGHNFIQTLKDNPVIPVAVFDDSEKSLKVAELLLQNGISIIEITARTEAAFQCMKAISRKFPEMIIGGGSILSEDSLNSARDSGAQFCVAPCLDEDLLRFSLDENFPFIPGIATPTELNMALKHCNVVKVFPAASLGGVSYIKSMVAPFALNDFYIMPTGGINEKNFKEYLAVERIISCGMSYIVDKGVINREEYGTLKMRIKEIISGLTHSQ